MRLMILAKADQIIVILERSEGSGLGEPLEEQILRFAPG
jgi:hypothetical protein